MNEEDIDFLISIQDLEQPEFDNACLQRENKRLQKHLDFMIERNDEKQQRIDKAIEYIKECQEVWHKRGDYWENELVDGNKLLEILGDK